MLMTLSSWHSIQTRTCLTSLAQWLRVFWVCECDQRETHWFSIRLLHADHERWVSHIPDQMNDDQTDRGDELKHEYAEALLGTMEPG